MKTFVTFAFSFGLAATLSAQTLSNYQNVVTSQSPAAYFKLDGTLADSVTPSQQFTATFFSYFGADAAHHLTNAYVFNQSSDGLTLSSDIIPGGDAVGTNDAAAAKGTISILFRALDAAPTGQRFIFGQGTGATTNGNALGLFVESSSSTNGPGDLKLRVGNTTSSIMTSNQFANDQWYYFAMTYDEARDSGEVLWYLGRSGVSLATGILNIANDAVVGDNGTVALGNQADLSSGYNNPGNGRVDEFAVWNRELSSTEISNQFAQLPDYFPANTPYQSLIAAQLPAHYLKLDGSLSDAMDSSTTVGTSGTGGLFTTNYAGAAGSAYGFNETNDAVIVTNDIVSGGGPSPNASATGSGSISFLFRMLSDNFNTGQRWIISQGTNNSVAKDALNLFLENTNLSNGDPNSLKLRLGNTTVSLVQPSYLVPNAWYYLALTYDENRNSQSGGEVRWYIGQVGGTLTNGAFNPANDAIVGDNGLVYLGNRVGLNLGFRNPGSGGVDEFATWNDELSPAEIAAQFAALTVQQGPAPTLAISVSGGNAVLSWPSSTPSAYQLEATASLSTPNWTNAGSATVVGSSYYVTNSITPVTQFFRLHKP